MVAALCSRHKKLPEQRRHVSFLFQIRLFFLRGLIQQIRSWRFLALDIFLPLLAAPFVGIFFYKRPYIGPLFTSYTPTVGLNVTCPAELLQYYPPLCGMMVMPLDDPLPSEASLTSLALALCAVASSLRIFGDERESFTRESSSGISTEAYYLGKSLAHLPVIFIAPLVFYLMYATFASKFRLFLVFLSSLQLTYTFPSFSHTRSLLATLRPAFVDLLHRGRSCLCSEYHSSP
jgi:hypothetical protein